ncbi:MAG: hypothetical protein JWN76_3427 [Chitinophagaceae bacterium]|nr:hypothetical protein [Chitinophagaceae bacterium]
MTTWEIIWGNTEKLNILQMSMRAFCAFFIMLLLIRIAGMRVFGLKSAFDSIIVITMGSVLARGIVGASPFLSTVAACGIMVLIHRILSYFSMRSTFVGNIVKGKQLLLYKDGKLVEENLKRASLTKHDIAENLRLTLNKNDWSDILEIYIERSGSISFILKSKEEAKR